MKYFLYLCLFAILLSCNKNTNEKLTTESKTDSLNKIIEKKNDSISILNNTNRFADWSGSHKLTHNSIKKNGEIKFEKVARDEYKVFGQITSGGNNLKISGTMKQVSEDYMN